MKETVSKTLKSSETEDWFDYHVVRPMGYLWAKLFAKLGMHPNTVTIISMIIGAASCFFFAHGSYHYEQCAGLWLNIIGILLLFWAYVYDCTDGQLARMTGKKSKLGRILDGAAGYAWYIPIYAALIYRFYNHHDLEFGWLGIADSNTATLVATLIAFALAAVSGIICLAGQQRTADYYIQVHLFFLKGEKGAELDNSVKQKEIYDQMGPETSFIERLIQKTYITYTKQQERRTPQFQNLMARLKEKFGDANNTPADIREEIHRESLKVMTFNFMLVFNFRTLFLIIFCLLDIPVLYFLFEIVVISLIECYAIHRHEAFCKRIAQSLK